MEQRYIAALEIIKEFCEKETYISTDKIMTIIDAILGKDVTEDDDR